MLDEDERENEDTENSEATYHKPEHVNRLRFKVNNEKKEKEKDDADKFEATFHKLEHVSKLGFKVNNENLWSSINYILIKTNYKKVIPSVIPDVIPDSNII